MRDIFLLYKRPGVARSNISGGISLFVICKLVIIKSLIVIYLQQGFHEPQNQEI